MERYAEYRFFGAVGVVACCIGWGLFIYRNTFPSPVIVDIFCVAHFVASIAALLYRFFLKNMFCSLCKSDIRTFSYCFHDVLSWRRKKTVYCRECIAKNIYGNTRL